MKYEKIARAFERENKLNNAFYVNYQQFQKRSFDLRDCMARNVIQLLYYSFIPRRFLNRL